jgi:hypothetical protein
VEDNYYHHFPSCTDVTEFSAERHDMVFNGWVEYPKLNNENKTWFGEMNIRPLFLLLMTRQDVCRRTLWRFSGVILTWKRG